MGLRLAAATDALSCRRFAVLRLRSVGWLITSQLVTAAAAFGSSILVAQALGPSGMGTVTVAQTVTGLAGVILAAGLPGAAGYLAAKRHVDGPTESRVAWSAALLATGVAVVVTVPLAPWLASTLFESDSTVYLWIAIIAIAPSIAMQIGAGFLLGVGRAREVAIVSMSSIVANLVGLVVLGRGGYLTPSTVIAIWLALLLGSALAQMVLLTQMPRRVESASVMQTVRLGARFGAASWASSGLHLLALRIDVLLLGALSGSDAVGVYTVGVVVAEVGWYLPNAVYGVLFPTVAAGANDAHDVVARVARVTWPVILGIGICLGGLASLIVVPLYGSAFAGAVGVVAALVPGITMGALGSVLSAYLAGIGKPGQATAAAALNLTVNVALCLILIPKLDETGAAAASSISYICGAALIVYFFTRETGVPLTSVLLPRRSDFVGAAIELRARLTRVADR